MLVLSKSTWVVQSPPLCPHLEFIVFIYLERLYMELKDFGRNLPLGAP